MRKLPFDPAAAFFTLLLFLTLLRPAEACTFAGTGVAAPCTFTLDASNYQCIKNVTVVSVTSLMDNNKINESATYLDLGAPGHRGFVAEDERAMGAAQTLRLFSIIDGPLPSVGTIKAVVVASGISDSKQVAMKQCACPVVMGNVTASFNPDTGIISVSGTTGGGCTVSGVLFAVLNRTGGIIATERKSGYPTGNAFSFSSANSYTSDDARSGLDVMLVAYGMPGVLGAYLPPIMSFSDFRVSLPKSQFNVEPGRTFEAAFAVANLGNEPATYNATAVVPAGWSSEKLVFSLGPNSQANQSIRITSSPSTFAGSQSVVISVADSSSGRAKTSAFLAYPSTTRPSLQSYAYPPKAVPVGRPFDVRIVLNATSSGTARYFFYTEPFIKIDSSGEKTSFPAGLSALTGSTTVRDTCALPDSARSLRKLNAYWSAMKDVLPGKDSALIRKMLGKINSYKGSVITPTLLPAISNATAIASSIESGQNADSRIAAMLADIDVLKGELNIEENKTASYKTCTPVGSVDLVLDAISYADASESMAKGTMGFASGDILNARLLDEAGGYVTKLDLGPGEVRNLKVEITNGDTAMRQFTVDVIRDGVLANFISIGKRQLAIAGGQTDVVDVTVQMPTAIGGAKNATILVSSSPYVKSLPVVVALGGPEVLGQESYTAEPGVSTTLSFSVRNNNKAEDTYTLAITGTEVKWFTGLPSTLSVGGNKEGKLQVKVAPSASVTAGAYNFTLAASSQQGQDTFGFTVVVSGEFGELRTEADKIDAIYANVRGKCPQQALNMVTVLKDARSLITGGRLSEAKTKLASARADAEAALGECTRLKIPFGAIILVLGGLAVAYALFFARRKGTPLPAQPAKKKPPTGGTELPPEGQVPEGPGRSKTEDETWI